MSTTSSTAAVRADAATPARVSAHGWIGATTAMIAILAGVGLVFVGLNGDRLNGDEHNAIVYLKEGLWEYIRTFHYGHVIKIQFWTMHALFGNSFFWYRLPAAVAAVVTIAGLALYRVPEFPISRIGRSLVALMIASNAAFLFFARWGMASYAETILACALLLGLVLADLLRGRAPAWGAWRLLLVAALPWLYPAAIVVLGGISAYLLLEVLAAWRRVRIAGGLTKAVWNALVPMLLGVVSLVVYRMTVPDAHWSRARSHHKAFSAWVEQKRGGVAEFIADSLARVGNDFMRMLPMAPESAFQPLAWLYTQLAWLLAMLVVLAIGLALWRARRLRERLPAMDLRFLRGAGLLVVTLAAALAVVSLATVLDAYPAGSLRHLFFLIPLPALLAILALSYLGHLAAPWLRRQALAQGTAVVAVGGLLVLATLVSVASYSQRRLERANYRELGSILRSPQTDFFLAWSPGFYFAATTLPGTVHFYQTEHGPALPGSLVTALKAAKPGQELAILTQADMLGAGGQEALTRLAQQAHLQPLGQARFGAYQAMRLQVGGATPSPQVAPVGLTAAGPQRIIDVAVDLPPGDIVSVRLDPTQRVRASVRIDSLVYTDGRGAHQVNVCADAALASMRTQRVGSGSGCSFVLGDGSNAGWIGPSALKNLKSDAAPRRLRIRMTGELGDEFRVYLDTGTGYSSPIRVKVEPQIAR